MLMKGFLEWSEKIKPELEHISILLSEELSDEPSSLIQNLTNIEAWNGRAGALLAQADAWLDRYTLEAMPQRQEGRLEADRKALLDSETSPIRLLRDTIEKYSDSIRQRLILGESILGYMKIYAEKQIMKPKITDKIY